MAGVIYPSPHSLRPDEAHAQQPMTRMQVTAMLAHFSWFFLPVLFPAVVWGLGRFIGSPFLTRTGKVVTLAQLVPWVLIALCLAGDAANGLTGGIVDGSAIAAAAGLLATAAMIFLLLARTAEAVLGGVAASRGEVRRYVLGFAS